MLIGLNSSRDAKVFIRGETINTKIVLSGFLTVFFIKFYFHLKKLEIILYDF